MSRLLEVREFEAITYNEEYRLDEGYKFLEKDSFDELEKFILNSQYNCESQTMDYLKISSKKNVGKIIQAKNFVGLIEIKNGVRVEILPKIFNSSVEETKKTFIRMLRCLKDFPSKVFNEANLKMDKMNLYEVFINMYIQQVRNLVKKGIKSAYLPVEDSSNFYKGKLLFQNNIKQNLLHKEKFYVTYDEFSENRPENRLIKSTLLKLKNITNSAENIKEIRQLLSVFEMINSSRNYIEDFTKVIIDRNTKDYKILLKWSKVFLMNKSFTIFSGSTNARALLFPMEKVFEAYVSRNLKKVLDDLNWDVSTQDRKYYLFDTPKKFALRPDIVINREDGSRVVLDTKWKILINKPSQNYGISQEDMYQMYAYAKKYKTPEIWLIYPCHEEMENSQDIRFECTEDEENIRVRIFFIDVANITDSLEALRKILVIRS
ncbi:McrC family protein [Clostridium cadaveris]|uniref:McrC family protein n=1 Tax=Clostridium cadaveris TaxID=1529 RepID=UPI0031DE264D